MKRCAWPILWATAGLSLGCDEDRIRLVQDGNDLDGGSQDHDAGSDESVASTRTVARGRYLVEHVAVCVDCHSPRNIDGSFDRAKWLSGVDCFVDVDPENPDIGCISSGNLTNHETGLENRSKQEIKDLFLRGERPDGKALHPFMPYSFLANMRDRDADAIVDYLRTVKGIDHMVEANQEPFLPPPQPAPPIPAAAIPMPRADYADRRAAMRGRYLAGNVGICMDCHTPRDERGAPILAKAFQGGQRFPRAELGLPPSFPEVIYSPNLTPHETGIAEYSVEDVVRALKLGEDKNQEGTPLCPPMPAGPMGPFGELTDSDATDIAHFLLSLPPAENEIPEDCRLPMLEDDADAGT
jgi:mono/diheme cytochrome c family protein